MKTLFRLLALLAVCVCLNGCGGAEEEDSLWSPAGWMPWMSIGASQSAGASTSSTQ